MVNSAMAGLLVLAALAHALAPGAIWRWLSLPATLITAYGALLLLHREVFCQWVEGANDNASGVAVTLALAEDLVRRPLGGTEVWCVFTGCEEVGAPVGMERFLERHGDALWDADLIIIDNVGAGSPRYLTGEGTFRTHRSDPVLLAHARAVAARHPDWRAGPGRVPRGSYTDAHPALARGWRGLAVWCERDGVLPNWHWPSDVLPNVEPAALEMTSALVRELLDRIDETEAST